MTTGIEQMLRAQLRDLNVQLLKHQRTILEQQDTIASLNRQIAALGKVAEFREREKAAAEVRPLPRGTIIDYCGSRATVIEDTGARTIKVWVDSDEQNWSWEFDGVCCTVVGFDKGF